MTLYCFDKLTGETTLDCNAISFIQTLAGRQIFLCIRGWCSAVDFVFFYLFFWSCTGDRTDSWNYWDGTRLRQWNQCTFWAQIISHQLFSDMTLCIYSCRGALSTLFITFPDWNWSLHGHLIRARRWTLSDAEELPVRCVVTWSLVDLFIYSSKGSLMWCWRVDANIMLCLIPRARRQLWHQPPILFWSAEVKPVSTVCPYSVIRHADCYCIPVL